MYESDKPYAKYNEAVLRGEDPAPDPIETLLKRALNFYEGSPDGQYDEVAAQCIRYALGMAPWRAADIQLWVFNGLRREGE